MKLLHSLVASALLVLAANAGPAWCQSDKPAPGKPAPAQRRPDLEAIRMEVLARRYDNQLQTIRALSNIRANGHEVNMQIIRNMGPSGRYKYNPSTGRYDRWVPYR
jgi:hypothetical protein